MPNESDLNQTTRTANNPADPWSYNAFDPPKPSAGGGVPFKPVVRQQRRDIPEQDELFAVQRNLMKAINELDNVERDAKVNMKPLRTQVENSYRILNRFLQNHAQG